MKIVFFGYMTWGLVTLRALIESSHTVELVITHFDNLEGYKIPFDESVKDYADLLGIPVMQSQNAREQEIIRRINELDVDLIVSSNWRRRIDSTILKSAKLGAINVHRALLPKYGGVSPINWAIINGETETGVTVHFMDESLDLGDIILQEKFPIAFTDTASDVFFKTNELIADMIPKAIGKISSKADSFIKQDKNLATFFHKRSDKDNQINWSKSNVDIYNLVRAQNDPFPNAYTFFKHKRLKIKKTSIPDLCYKGTPSRVFARVSDGVIVLCGESDKSSNQGITVHVVQEEDNPPIAANKYFDKAGYYLDE